MTSNPPFVAIVDDDESVRESLPDLLRELGYAAQAFVSAEAFLASPALGKTGCLLLDISMPGMSGPALHCELRNRGYEIPTILITALPEKSRPSRPTGTGIVACLTKPFSELQLKEALTAACL